MFSSKTLHLFQKDLAFILFPVLDFSIGFKTYDKLSITCRKTGLIKGLGLVLVWGHKLICMHIYKDLLRCKSVCDVKPGPDLGLLLAWSWDRWCLDIVTFTDYKKVTIWLKRTQKGEIHFKQVQRFILVISFSTTEYQTTTERSTSNLVTAVNFIGMTENIPGV